MKRNLNFPTAMSPRPLIGGVKELENQAKIVKQVAEEVLEKAGDKPEAMRTA